MHKTITVRLAASVMTKYKWTYIFMDNYPRMVRETITREHVTIGIKDLGQTASTRSTVFYPSAVI